MNRFRLLAALAVLLLPACATLGRGSGGGERDALWSTAHTALAAGSFRAADSAFSRLATRYPRTEEGREALFFLGAIRVDPRNSAFSARGAADYLRRYLAVGDSASGRMEAHRKPEAQTLLGLAEQLNLPSAERVAALQAEQPVRTVTVPGPTRQVPSGESSQAAQAEAERLRGEVAERDATIRQLREELNRIRNTLAPPGRRP